MTVSDGVARTCSPGGEAGACATRSRHALWGGGRLSCGTGGTAGVPFLRAALELTFFPELYAVRTEIGT